MPSFLHERESVKLLRLFVLLTLYCLCPMGGGCASFLKGVGGFVCFSAVPGEVTAIPALSQKHIHLCEKGGR